VNRRLLSTVLVATVFATVAVVSALADSGGVTVTPISRLRFPERGFLVGLPNSKPLTSADVAVRENNRLVRDPSFVTAEASTEHLGVLLVIDASNSMRGQPLDDAFASARLLADRLLPSERVGLLTFNATPTVAQEPTADASTVTAALAQPPGTKLGTHIYDALAQALTVVRRAHLSSSSIVLLSDGADTGSKNGETALITRAQRQRVRIFAVGLHSESFKATPLAALARDTGGTYAQATSSADLAPLFDQLGQTLASEYVLRYRSDANPGAHIVLTVDIRGEGKSTFTYLAPAISAVPPFHRSLLERFWGSAASAVVIALLGAGLAALALMLLLRRRPSQVAARIAEFATLISEPDAADSKTLLSSRLLGGTERSLARTRWWAHFREELEIASIDVSAQQMLGLAIVGTLIVGLVLYLISPVFCIFGLFVPLLVRSYCKNELRKVRFKFEEQLPDNLQVLASALRAGHSFVGALSVVAADAAEPSKREFTRVVADEQLGVPLEDSLREIAGRMANSDLEQVALVAELQRQTGGNMAEVLERVIETIRGRFDLRRLIRTLTAQGKMARWILTFLPIALAAFISLINPQYIKPLFTTTGGQIILTIATLMIIMGSLAIKRIVDIKV
jgi:tight adherence protein B